MVKNFIKKIMIFNSFLSIFLISTIVIPINAIDELEQFEKMNKKSKVLSCIALTKARINHDVVFIFILISK